MYAHAKPLRASQCVPGLPVVVRQASGAVAEGFRGSIERMNTHVHVRLMDYGDEVIVRQHHDADVLDCVSLCAPCASQLAVMADAHRLLRLQFCIHLTARRPLSAR